MCDPLLFSCFDHLVSHRFTHLAAQLPPTHPLSSRPVTRCDFGRTHVGGRRLQSPQLPFFVFQGVLGSISGGTGWAGRSAARPPGPSRSGSFRRAIHEASPRGGPNHWLAGSRSAPSYSRMRRLHPAIARFTSDIEPFSTFWGNVLLRVSVANVVVVHFYGVGTCPR